jgi:hypothetical protein
MKNVSIFCYFPNYFYNHILILFLAKLIPTTLYTPQIKDCFGESTQQYPISQISQLLVLTRRTMLCTFRDIHLFWFRFFTQLSIAVLLGLVFYDIGNDASKITSNASCIFFFLMVIFFCNTFPVIVSCKRYSLLININ